MVKAREEGKGCVYCHFSASWTALIWGKKSNHIFSRRQSLVDVFKGGRKQLVADVVAAQLRWESNKVAFIGTRPNKSLKYAKPSACSGFPCYGRDLDFCFVRITRNGDLLWRCGRFLVMRQRALSRMRARMHAHTHRHREKVK